VLYGVDFKKVCVCVSLLYFIHHSHNISCLCV
jgi:hypothetical protein